MSMPLDFGWWVMRNGQRRLLTWWSDTGALILGDTDVIAICYDEDDLRRRLTAWPDHCDLRDGLGWVAAQMVGCR
jgi:hypothetical protein